MDKKDFIVGQASRLPVDDRKAVCKAILDTIERDALAVDAKTRFKQLLPKAEVAIGWKYEPRRKMNGDAYIRNLIARTMRTEGYTCKDIAQAIGRHYSSVVTMAQKADDMANGYYGKELQRKYNDFIKAI